MDCPVYLDEKKTIYTGLKSAKWWWLLNRSLVRLLNSAKPKYGGTSSGPDGFQLGGFVVAEQDGTIVYQWEQGNFGEHPDANAVMKAVAPNEKKTRGPRKQPALKGDAPPAPQAAAPLSKYDKNAPTYGEEFKE